jgi:CBS domain-containing protein
MSPRLRREMKPAIKKPRTVRRREPGVSRKEDPPGTVPTARDVMTRFVITVGLEHSLRELANMLKSHQITGCPVVDSKGAVVGVVSGSDLVTQKSQEPTLVARDPLMFEPESDPDTGAGFDPHSYFRLDASEIELLKDGFAREDYSLDGCVADIFTPGVIGVSPRANFRHMVRVMLDRHVHRLLVLDKGKLVGIVTSLDLLRAMADRP